MADPVPFHAFGSRELRQTSPAMTGTDVQVLQVVYDEMLRIMHPPQGPIGPSITIDGIFGPQTRQAVVNLQGYFGLSADGVVGPVTFLAFGQATGQYVTYGGPAFGSRVLSPGSHGGDVSVLQNRLNCFRYSTALTGPADGAFGPETSAAVTDFQQDMRAYGRTLPDEHHQVAPYTARLLWFYTYTGGRNLEQGRNGLDTAWLQYYLANTTNPGTGRVFYAGAVDGYFGPVTRDAVRTFQASCGISADGIAGAATYHAIGQHNAQPAPRPAPLPVVP